MSNGFTPIFIVYSSQFTITTSENRLIEVGHKVLFFKTPKTSSFPGISPSEAVERLHNFQHRYALYDAKRKTLDSVSKLFGIPCKPFPELDKTGEVEEKSACHVD